MKRSTIVIGATVAGLVGVLTFHTNSAPLVVGTLPQSSTNRVPTSTPAAAGPPSGSRSATNPSSGTSTTTGSRTRSATGPQVNYNYGILAVAVTVSGSKIVNVQIASLQDGGNFRSQSIDQQAIPILEQQALQTQNANIQGVSGASYTSAGFEQSLQAALSQLQFK